MNDLQLHLQTPVLYQLNYCHLRQIGTEQIQTVYKHLFIWNVTPLAYAPCDFPLENTKYKSKI